MLRIKRTTNPVFRKTLIRPLSFLVLVTSTFLSLAPSATAEKSFRAIFHKAPAGSPEKLYAHVLEHGVYPIKLPRRSFSSSIELPDGDLVVRISEKETLPPETPLEETVNLKIPSGMKSFLMFTYPNPDQQGPGVAIQLEETSKVRPGEMMWINTTTFTVGGSVGDETVVVRPGDIKFVGAPADRGDSSYKLKLDFMAKGSNKQQRLYSGTWPYDSNSRLIAFVTAGASASAPQINVIKDHVSKE